MKRFLSLFLALCLLFSLIPAALADGEAIQCSTTIESCDNSVISKYGNVSLSITVENFLNQASLKLTLSQSNSWTRN